MTILATTKPTAGTTVDATVLANNFTAIENVVNGNIDQSNFTSGKIFDPTKLLQGGATNGQVLAWSGSNWAPATISGTPGTELAYDQRTTNLTVSHTTEGTADTVITGSSITYDGTKVRLEFFTPKITAGAAGIELRVVFLMDSTVVGQSNIANYTVAGSQGAIAYHTPSAGSHTYSVKAFDAGIGGSTIYAGAGGSGNLLPAFLRVTKA